MTDKAATERRHPNVVNVSEVEPFETSKGSKFALKVKRLGSNTGATGVGCNWFEVPPGKTAFPFHFHCGIEEALFVLEGTGTLRVGDARVKVEAGDWVSLPPGPEHAHQLLNSGTGPLRYLCLSDKTRADVVGYPDSKKIGALAGPGGFDPSTPPWVRAIVKEDAQVDYYDGESVD